MKLARLVLWMTVVAWAAFGLWLFAVPEALAGVGLPATDAMGRIEVRGFYGGLELGIAAFTAWCALDPSRFRAGLTLSALALGGLATGRLVGTAIEGEGIAMMWMLMGVEYSGAVLAVLGLRALAAER